MFFLGGDILLFKSKIFYEQIMKRFSDFINKDKPVLRRIYIFFYNLALTFPFFFFYLKVFPVFNSQNIYFVASLEVRL